VSFYFFLSPIFVEREDVMHPFLLSLAVSAGLIFIPTTVLRTVLCLRCFMAAKDIDVDDDNDDYYRVQHMWSKEMKYHKDHFLYAKLPEKVNPEFLEPGQTCVTKLEDVKGSYGQATAQEAEKNAGITLTGGKKLGATSTVEDDIETGTRACYGVSVAAAKPTEESDTKSPEESDTKSPEESESKSLEDIDVESPEEPASPRPPALADHSSVGDMLEDVPRAPTSHMSGNHAWEWQHGDHWTAFSDDCKDYIEKRYQEYVCACRGKGKGKGKGKGQSCIHVKTKGKEISIDFSKMTSKAKESSKINPIRRRQH
jgi:hypothetical protein